MNKITYYANVTGRFTRENPGGLFRRVADDPSREEALYRDMQWHPSTAISLSEMGQVDYDYEEITEAEAEVIVARWRRESGDVDQ